MRPVFIMYKLTKGQQKIAQELRERIFLPNGYINFAAIREAAMKDGSFPFVMLVGGRGIGKTYNVLDNIVENGDKFIYLRRSNVPLELAKQEKYNPFKKLNHNKGLEIHVDSNGGSFDFVRTTEDGDDVVGYGMALSTAKNVRGIDAFDVTVMFYDEFIREPTERKIKNEAEALWNLYETINRNRELDGEKPLLLVMCSNSNQAANPIFINLGITSIVFELGRYGYPAIYPDRKRGILLIDFGPESPISKAKAQTALYRLTAGTEFARMAIENQYTAEQPSRTRSRPLQEYTPLVFVGEVAVYQHKSQPEYYCSTHRSGSAPTYGSSTIELERFRRVFAWLWLSYMGGKVTFENYLCEALLTAYFK